MRRHVAALVVLVLCASSVACGSAQRPRPQTGSVRAGDGAVVVAQTQVARRIVDLAIRSPALGATTRVRLLTPEAWRDRRAGRTWPVLYLLHGCCDTYDSWTRETDLARISALRDVLVVMPAAGAVGFYSDWLNDGRRGRPSWETFHLVELRQILERSYGAGRRRAIAGLSMGGLGAMAYAARHRGIFTAAASYSGLLHPIADARVLLDLFAAHTPDPLAIWGDPDADRAQWAAHDPTELAARLRGVRLFVASGNGEPGPLDRDDRPRDPVEATVLRESRAFLARLRRLRIPVHADLYGAGVHDWPYWQRELHRSLPLLLGGVTRTR
jgi:diacylglycerol O-acyltransferase / trehalose O-mycolyltransferase